RRARARRRPRPAGECDLRSRHARERHLELRPARRRAGRRAREADRVPNLFLVPSKPELAGVAVELAGRDGSDRYLAESLSDSEGFDFVLLDCPPSLGTLTVNALAAADRVVVPVQAEYYALDGLATWLRHVILVSEHR